MIIDEEAAEIVREVFTLFSQGYGKTAIARMLNDRGHSQSHRIQKSPRPALSATRKRSNSTLWKYYAISDMLINEIYIGNMVQGKYGSVSYKTKQNKPRPKDQWYIVEGTHEPIIDRDLWDKVQSLISQKAKPFTTGEIGIFARKARCMNCGYIMRSNKQADGRRYLCCPTRHVAKGACEGAFISIKRLEQQVIDELNQMSEENLDKDELERKVEFCNNMNEQREKLNKDLTAYQKKIAEYSKGIRELYLDKVKGLITESEYVDFSKDFSSQKDHLEKLVIETQKQLTAVEKKMEAGDNRRQLIEQYTNLKKIDRATVEKLIDYIEVGKRIPGTLQVPVDIHWNF